MSTADAERLVRRKEERHSMPRGQAVAWLDDPIGHGVRIFIPGRLRNPLNERKLANGFVWDRYKKKWQAGMGEALAIAGWDTDVVHPSAPKRVLIRAHVFNRFDSIDGLRAALKPIPDGLKKYGLIDDDRDSAGHTFEYAQVINRAFPGVEVLVRW